MIRLAKRTLRKGNKTRLELWEEHLKDPIAALDKSIELRCKSVLRLMLARGSCEIEDAMTWRPWGFGSDATVVGRGPVAFSGCMGKCAFTHNLYTVECPKEIRAVRRALLFPFEERADGPQGAGSAGAQHPAAWRASLLFDAE